jgi:hemoglobin
MNSTFLRCVPTAVLICSLVTSSFAADGPVTPRELDSRIEQAIVRAIGVGAPIYNQGDQAGCYRLYQGALFVIEPMLGHRAGLRQEVAKSLKDVESVSTYTQRATDLRRILDRTLALVRTAPSSSPSLASASPTMPPKSQSLWIRLGGEPAVRAVVRDFVALAARDPQVDFTRGGKYALDAAAIKDLEGRLVELVSAVTGGPLRYEGRDMKSAHRGMAITDAQFDALAGDLVVVLKKFDVPKKEADELLAIIASTRKDIVESR